MIVEDKKRGGIGASEVGALFTQAGLKAKTAQTLMFEKAKEMITGTKRDITTPAMMHGIFSEEEAFNLIIKPSYPNAKYQSSDSIHIKEGVWVTPDVVDDSEGLTIDIKCPYTPFTYWKNIKKLPTTYLYQNQMQMIGTGHKKGMVCIYLTSTQMDEWGNKIEYDIDINERHCFMPIESQPEMQNEIMSRIDEFFPQRDLLISDLLGAVSVTDKEFFDLCKTKKVTRLKDKSNLFTWADKLYLNGFEYYVIE